MKDPVLSIQALVDRELDPESAAQVETQLSKDSQALALRDRLLDLKRALRENEMTHPLPVPPEFYWRGIEQWIRPASARSVPESMEEALPSLQFLIRRALPILGTLCLVFAFSAALWFQFRGERGAILGTNHDIENSSGDVSTMSFRSESEGITVVWVAARDLE